MSTQRRQSAITAKGLRKSYGDKVVLDGIDLNIPAGTIFALLGPNGAGKTTAVQILSTYIAADAGEVHVAGHDLARNPQRIRAAIGASRVSSPRSTICSAPKRTCCSWQTCTTSAAPRADGARGSCSGSSTWSTRPARLRPPTPAACGASSISP